MTPLRIDLADGVATCGDLSSTHSKSAICDLARKLIGLHDFCAPVEIYRGDTLCFKPAPLWKWAKLTVSEPTQGSIRFADWKPFAEGAFS